MSGAFGQFAFGVSAFGGANPVMTAPQLAVQLNGQGSVSADNLNTYQQTCDNIAQLRAFVGAPGVQVYVRGLVAVGDGGQGNFIWIPNVIGSDDGNSIVVPTSAATGFWQRLSVENSSSNVIACIETGTNLLTLTPINGIQQPFAYSNYQEFSFVAAATSTGPVTAQVAGLPALGVYLPNNTQAGSGAFVVRQFYVIAYNSALNSGTGGFSLFSGSSAAGVTSVADAANGGLAFSAATGVVTANINVSDLAVAIPVQSSTIPFESAAGAKRAALAGAANSLVAVGAATKAQMQVGTDNTTVVTPVRVNDSDGAAKAWFFGSGAGGGLSGFNVGTAIRNSVGNYTLSFITAFASGNYVMDGTADDGTNMYTVQPSSKLAGSVNIVIRNSSTGTLTDVNYNVIFYGRQ